MMNPRRLLSKRMGLLALGLVLAVGCGSTAPLGPQPSTSGAGGGTSLTTTASSSGSTGSGGGSQTDPMANGTDLPPPDAQANVACLADMSYSFSMIAPQRRGYSSPVRARALVNAGVVPPASLIVESEFISYFTPKLAIDTTADGVSVELHALVTPPRTMVLYALVAAAPKPKLATSMTIVLDTSLSLDGTPLELARAAIEAVDGHLDSNDTLTIVTSGAPDKPITLHGQGPENAATIGALAASGKSDLGAALSRAYDVAVSGYVVGGANRMIVITDGAVPAAALREDAIRRYAIAEHPIPLVAIDVGAATEPHAVLSRAAAAGRGSYVFLDTPAEAQRMFGERYDEVLGLGAQRVHVDVTMPAFLTAAPLGSTVGSVGGLVAPDLGPGSASIFRLELSSCTDLTNPSLDLNQVISLTPSWEDGEGPTLGALGVGKAATASIGELLLASKSPPSELTSLEAITMAARAMHDFNATRLKTAETNLCTLAAANTLSPGGKELYCSTLKAPLITSTCTSLTCN